MVVQEAPSDPTHSTAEQALLALTLITTWALATGRRLRADVPPEQLTEAELIDFWADPLLAPETLS
ncbi:MAG TPA: hypothetical protein VFU43_12330 [Streptosporangiaceae bacterium]|nr:hypothetical protein [Streptosporangiaceae bacterium]